MNFNEAIEFAAEHFPRAPEKLAEYLGVTVRYRRLSCDGWCIQNGTSCVVSVNNGVVETRQRFTLAHEMGHIVMGVPSIVGETGLEIRRAHNSQERKVNELAAELLLPSRVAASLVKQIPITAKDIKRVAKKANTSETFVARRLASLSKDLGLIRGTVLFFNNTTYTWQWPDDDEVKVSRKAADHILIECGAKEPNPARFQNRNKSIVVASLLENPFLNSRAIFVQEVDEQHGSKKLDEELLHDLQKVLFAPDDTYRQSLSGYFGLIKPKIANKTLEEAVDWFNEKYTLNEELWDRNFRLRLASKEGQQFIRLRLKMLQQR